MTKVFNVYKKDGTKVLTEVTSPAKITGLLADKTYPKGEFQVSAIEEGKAESEKVDIPEFKTQALIVDPPVEPSETA
ncbi:tail tube protein [Enterococcus phage vB_EfaS_Ef6.1]|nr:tail tube protein [Enterococcus phage vB_EfaS_Ef6.1]